MNCYLRNWVTGFCLLGWSALSAQTPVTPNYSQCDLNRQDAQAIKNRMLDNRRNAVDLRATFNQARSSNNKVYVPVQFFIVNKGDGTGGAEVQNVLDNLCKLNQDFAFVDVEFYLGAPIEYINLDLLYDNNSRSMTRFFMGQHKKPGMMNIFVGNSIQSPNGGTILGYYDPNVDVIYAIKSQVNGSSLTLTHEGGHYFSLPHTFNGWEDSNGGFYSYDGIMQGTNGRTPTLLPDGDPVELIARTGGEENCQIAGDGFCDTDANYIFGYYRASYNTGTYYCDHASGAIDPTGRLFRPDLVSLNPVRFKVDAGSPHFTELIMESNFVTGYYPRTLLVTKALFTPASGTPIEMWQDTIGDSDSTDFQVLDSPNSLVNNIIGSGSLDIAPGFITMGDYVINQTIATTTTGITFNTGAIEYSVTGTGGNNHQTTIASLEVTNTTGTAIPAGVVITVTEQLDHSSNGTISSESWTITTNAAIPANGTLTIPSADLVQQKSTIAGGVLAINQYAPNQNISGTSSDNIMSYYGDDCVMTFSPQQGDAMKLDIASRGLATLNPPPSDILITDQALGITPTANDITNNNTVFFNWNAVNGATHYHVHIYEVSTIGTPITNGEIFDFISTTTSYTGTLSNQTNYAWTVTPLNQVSFCATNNVTSDPILFKTGIGTNVTTLNSTIENTKIYPNPSYQQVITLEINATRASSAQVNMINSLGQVVMPSLNIDIQEGLNIQRLNTANLAAGLYNVLITTGDKTHQQQLIINP